MWKEREASASSGRKKEQIEPSSLNGRSKERATVSASLNSTALKKSATSKGRNINSKDGVPVRVAVVQSLHLACDPPICRASSQAYNCWTRRKNRVRFDPYGCAGMSIVNAVVNGIN